MYLTSSETEKMIKDYFKDLKTIGLLQNRVEELYKFLNEVQNDINNSNITLSAGMQAIDYTRDKIQANSAGSVQENEMERAFSVLERQKERLETEIIELKTKIRELKKNTQYMESIIHMLTEESRKFVDLRYQKNKTYCYIALELNSSATSIARLQDMILRDVSNWIMALA